MESPADRIFFPAPADLCFRRVGQARQSPFCPLEHDPLTKVDPDRVGIRLPHFLLKPGQSLMGKDRTAQKTAQYTHQQGRGQTAPVVHILFAVRVCFVRHLLQQCGIILKTLKGTEHAAPCVRGVFGKRRKKIVPQEIPQIERLAVRAVLAPVCDAVFCKKRFDVCTGHTQLRTKECDAVNDAFLPQRRQTGSITAAEQTEEQRFHGVVGMVSQQYGGVRGIRNDLLPRFQPEPPRRFFIAFAILFVMRHIQRDEAERDAPCITGLPAEFCIPERFFTPKPVFKMDRRYFFGVVFPCKKQQRQRIGAAAEGNKECLCVREC